jgi:2-phospho-L-lactate/phosphoenolpyruvate guanylyltransferase
MSWTAIIPFKPAGERKTRLADMLSAEQREGLAEQLFAHVLAVLGEEPRIASVLVLSQLRPSHWTGAWRADAGLGLNAELQAARADIAGPMLVLHSDLPLLIPANVIQLLDAAEAAGLAIAPDRHGSGTNALALGDGRPFAFSFGADSYHLHRRQISGHWRMVPAPGFAIDIDTPADLALAVARGFCPAA